MQNDQLNSKKKKKIVVGITGGIDSAVTAYLLTKQGFDCVGVGIMFLDEKNRGKVNDDFFQNSCSVNDMDNAKQVCDFLNIPFFAVKATKQFEADILDPLVARCLIGESFSPCLYCNALKLKILYDKMAFLKADGVATGHFAKIHRNVNNNEYEVYSSFDQEFDQSFLIAKLAQEHLEKLVLPLGDLRKKEVEKIANLYKIPSVQKRDSRSMCFVKTEGLPQYIELKSPRTLRSEGVFVVKETDIHIGDHNGIHNFYIGQPNPSNSSASENAKKDKDLIIVGLEYTTKRVMLGHEKDLVLKDFFINELTVNKSVSLEEPKQVFLKLGFSHQLISAKIYFKNNSSARIELDSPVAGIQMGMEVALYSSGEGGAKLLGAGIVSYIKLMKLLNRVEHLETKVYDSNGIAIETPDKEFKY